MGAHGSCKRAFVGAMAPVSPATHVREHAHAVATARELAAPRAECAWALRGLVHRETCEPIGQHDAERETFDTRSSHALPRERARNGGRVEVCRRRRYACRPARTLGPTPPPPPSASVCRASNARSNSASAGTAIGWLIGLAHAVKVVQNGDGRSDRDAVGRVRPPTDGHTDAAKQNRPKGHEFVIGRRADDERQSSDSHSLVDSRCDFWVGLARGVHAGAAARIRTLREAVWRSRWDCTHIVSLRGLPSTQ